METNEKKGCADFAEVARIIEQNKEELLEALSSAVRIQSDQAEPVTAEDGSVYPFGAGVQQVHEAVLAMGREMGFEAVDIDHYGGHIDFRGSEDSVMGIVGHLDVVPAAGCWDFDPYGGEIRDGYIYGRGTTDDKGPVLACLYAMKALKEAGFTPKSTVRLILGLDEETGWKGMEYYLERVPAPDFGFTPDGDFPIINGEKGNLVFEAARKFAKSSNQGLTLRSIHAGNAANSVPDAARAVVRNPEGDYSKIKAELAAFREETGYKLNCKGIGKSLELTAAGRGAHGATPEAGLNAFSILMAFLGRLNFANEEQNDWIAFYNRCIGFDLCGEKLGIGFSDEVSGKLVLNVGMAEMNPELAKLIINIRYPISCTQEQVFAGMAENFEKYNIGWVLDKNQDPLYMDLDNPMVKTLLEVYRSQTGDEESQPLVIGGGTYARAMKHVIAYGGLFPGDEDRMHQPNERLSVERLLQMTKIYAEAIYKLASGAYNK